MMSLDPECWNRRSVPQRWLGVAILVLLLAAPPMARSAQAGALETANVMAPLDMRFMRSQQFSDFAEMSKAIGDREASQPWSELADAAAEMVRRLALGR